MEAGAEWPAGNRGHGEALQLLGPKAALFRHAKCMTFQGDKVAKTDFRQGLERCETRLQAAKVVMEKFGE